MIQHPPIRTAVVGYGLGGAAFHAPLVAANPAFSLDAIVTRDAGRRAAAHEAHPRARLVAGADALWELPAPPELVVISTPNATHAALAVAALARGAHVVVDKPLAVTAAEGRAIADAARTAGRLAVPFQNRRWDGDFRTLQRLVADGTLGTVHRLVSAFDRWRPAPRGGWREANGADEGGGLLHDIASHLADQAMLLFGPVRSVYAELDRRREGVRGNDDAWLALTHASGVRSHLHCTVVAAQAAPRFRVLGSRAAWVKWGLDPQEALLRAGAHPAPGDSTWGVEDENAWGLLGHDGETVKVPTERGDYPAFYEGVARAIRGDAPPPVAITDAIAGLEVIEGALRSAREGSVVTLGGEGGVAGGR